MARKQPKKSLHPYQITEAIEAMNEAAMMLVSRLSVASNIMSQLEMPPEQVKEMGAELRAAVTEFRAVMWPEED